MHIMYGIAAVIATSLFAGPAGAGQAGGNVEYSSAGVQLEGYLAEPQGASGKLPAVMIFHDWDGLNEYEKMRADQLSKLGYVAFAADIYGKGVRPATLDACRAEVAKFYQDPKLLLDRARAGLDYLKSLPNVDPERIGVIGYCFGGKAGLELARSKAEFRALVCFHGALDTTTPAAQGAIEPDVLILHGGADQAVTPEQVADLVKEMIAAGARFELVVYPGAPHAFTVPGPSYREDADKASWQRMREFLKQTIGPGI